MIMQPRISSNTNLIAFSRDGKRTMDVLIPLYAEYGYKNLDLNFCEMMNPGSILNTEHSGEYITRLRKAKEHYSLEYIQAHAPYPHDYMQLPDKEKKSSDEAILRSMDWAAELGIPHIVVHPIRAGVEENIRYFSSLLGKQRKSVRIAVENMETRDEIWSAADLKAIASALSPMAGICLDTGHAHIAGADIPSFIAESGELLIGTHIADNNGKEDQHLLPGFGTIDWESTMKALKSGYRGYINYECMYFSRYLPQDFSEDVIRLSLKIGDWLLSL